MNSKGVARAVLLLFVVYSLVVVVAKQFGPEAATTEPGEAVASDVPSIPATGSRVAGPKFIVYYFHGRERCDNCRNLESWAKEAVQTAFAGQFAAGQMEWRVVDFSQPRDAHYDRDYKLGGVSSVLISEMRDGAEVRWKLLDEGLMLAVTGTSAQVSEYVQRETHAFINQ